MFSCCFCKMEFVRSEDLQRHVEAAHTIDEMEGSTSDEKDITIDTKQKSHDEDYEPEPEPEKVKVLKRKRKASSVKKVR